MTAKLVAIELRAERARLMRDQHALAARISSYYPMPAGQPRPFGVTEASRQAQANTARIREIDADLATLKED